MKAKKYGFESIKIASPCKADWNEMTGDDRARFCSLCQHHVYNFSSMTGHEIAQLIKEREGKRTCVRFFKRADGTMMTKDCPVGFQRRRRRAVGTIAAMASVAFGGFGWLAIDKEEEPLHTMGIVMGEIEVLPQDEEPAQIMGRMVMGDIAVPKKTP
ncbi:MAG: hypothetical protein KTR29_22970 [Rhodothermaceae bacterium]|nr:hypothetical protein [Rhodothermaceae bacterium]